MHSSLEQLHAGFTSALQHLSPQALEVHPANDSGRWNSRQIVEHLLLTYQSSSAVFTERLAKGRATQLQLKPYQRVQQFFVCRFGFFPEGRPAPPWVIPQAGATEPLAGNDLCSKLRAALQSMDEQLTLCERQFGGKKFATHQIIGPLSARQWRRFHVVHGRHHLKQIRSLHADTPV